MDSTKSFTPELIPASLPSDSFDSSQEVVDEISTTVSFFSQYLIHNVEHEKVSDFQRNLTDVLINAYTNHWDPVRPLKGSAYRALNIISGQLDATLTMAAQSLKIENVNTLFPENLVLFCDPGHVSYRLGDYNYITTIFETNSSHEGLEYAESYGSYDNNSLGSYHTFSPEMNYATDKNMSQQQRYYYEQEDQSQVIVW